MNDLKDKKELRQMLRQQTDAMSFQDRGAYNKRIAEQIEQHIDLSRNSVIGLYYPFGSEVDINDFWEQKMLPQQLAFPAIVGEQIVFVSQSDSIVLHRFGMKQPCVSSGTIVVPDILFIPVIGINHRGYRLGYGKGYYDRYLAKQQQIRTIALHYEIQKTTRSFENAWDIPMQNSISEKCIYQY